MGDGPQALPGNVDVSISVFFQKPYCKGDPACVTEVRTELRNHLNRGAAWLPKRDRNSDNTNRYACVKREISHGPHS